MSRALSPELALSFLLFACAAGQSRATTPAPREIVVEEAAVVQVRRPTERDPGALPELPLALPHTSPSFQHGFALAEAELNAPPPPSAPESGSTALWLEREFNPWLEARGTAIERVAQAFAARGPDGAEPPAHEQVVALALLGRLHGRLFDQLAAVPPPENVRADAALERVYRASLFESLAPGLKTAIESFRRCAVLAAHQRELAFGPWLELCHDELATRLQQQSQGLALQLAVAAEREAERRAAEGPRPPGPEICWTAPPQDAPATALEAANTQPAPAVPAPAPEAANTQPASAAPAPAPEAANTQPASAAPAAAAGCARRAGASAEPEPPRTPRDLRYGPRDPQTGVRVSVALEDNPTMDARPLAAYGTLQRLTRCFAQHVPKDRDVTVAVHAHLTIDARGRTRSAAVTPEPSDAASPPGKPLERCLVRELQRVAFDCSPSGAPTQARASYCLRREPAPSAQPAQAP